MASPTPVPPTELHQRVAGPLSDERNYEANGLLVREDILSLLQAYWGRAFDVEEVRPSGFGTGTQGVLRLRKRDVALTPRDLEPPEPGEPREFEAARHHARQLCREIAFLREEREHQTRAQRAGRELAERLGAERDALSAAHHRLESAVREFRESRSWRLTRPLRSAARAARRARG